MGAMKKDWIGTPEHKRLFCDSFMRTHLPFEPGEFDLPENDRRLAPCDPRLIRPTLVPSPVRFALKMLPLAFTEPGGVSAESPRSVQPTP